MASRRGPSSAVKAIPTLVIGRDNLEDAQRFVENGTSDLAQIVLLADENKDVDDVLRFLLVPLWAGKAGLGFEG